MRVLREGVCPTPPLGRLLAGLQRVASRNLFNGHWWNTLSVRSFVRSSEIVRVRRKRREGDGVKSVGDVLPITASIYRDFQILICALDSGREAWTFALQLMRVVLHTQRERRSPSPSPSQVLSRVFEEKNCEAISVRHSRERVVKEEYVDLHAEAGLQCDVRSNVTFFKR